MNVGAIRRDVATKPPGGRCVTAERGAGGNDGNANQWPWGGCNRWCDMKPRVQNTWVGKL